MNGRAFHHMKTSKKRNKQPQRKNSKAQLRSYCKSGSGLFIWSSSLKLHKRLRVNRTGHIQKKNYVNACFFCAGNLVRLVSISFVKSYIEFAHFTLGRRRANVSSTIRGQRREALIRARPWQVHPLGRRRPWVQKPPLATLESPKR